MVIYYFQYQPSVSAPQCPRGMIEVPFLHYVYKYVIGIRKQQLLTSKNKKKRKSKSIHQLSGD